MRQYETMELDELTELLSRFNAAREWGQFHRPRNLLLALVGEVGELAAELQWVSDADVESWLAEAANLASVRNEVADVFAYLMMLADALGIDLGKALIDKVEANELRYPVEKFRGSSKRYDASE